ncbi:hypothetical protein CALVIDRAFT_542983 [Calocera viscosa TUFC12733]|uniref:Uncharacterized protein n=1 Tax=Calocera viscosa (strain TUFC12733) TaxID=1330018 RepID=A0A167G3Z3_CALVF|nr:hypothetical protein CALVIDRAFT_542983 [Calocera viscosa TUFC12733]
MYGDVVHLPPHGSSLPLAHAPVRLSVSPGADPRQMAVPLTLNCPPSFKYPQPVEPG